MKKLQLLLLFACFSYLFSIKTVGITIADYLLELETSKGKEQQVVQVNPHVTAGHAKALRAIEQEKHQQGQTKTVLIEITKLTDNQGREYLAGLVNKAELSPYLEQLQWILGERYQDFRQHQSARDHGLFHVTLVNPFEYQNLTNKSMALGRKIRVKLHGLGRVSRGDDTSYFVVASSADGQFIRQNYLLPNKDFHVTLGFNREDVHGVSKGKDALISVNK